MRGPSDVREMPVGWSYETRPLNERSEYSGCGFIFRSPEGSSQPTPLSDKSVIRGRGGLLLWEGCSVDNQRVQRCNASTLVQKKIATDHTTVRSDWNGSLEACSVARS